MLNAVDPHGTEMLAGYSGVRRKSLCPPGLQKTRCFCALSCLAAKLSPGLAVYFPLSSRNERICPVGFCLRRVFGAVAEEYVAARRVAIMERVMIQERQELNWEYLATKDFVRAEVPELRPEMRSEIGSLRVEMYSERGSIRTEMAAMKTRLTEKIMSMQIWNRTITLQVWNNVLV